MEGAVDDTMTTLIKRELERINRNMEQMNLRMEIAQNQMNKRLMFGQGLLFILSIVAIVMLYDLVDRTGHTLSEQDSAISKMTAELRMMNNSIIRMNTSMNDRMDKIDYSINASIDAFVEYMHAFTQQYANNVRYRRDSWKEAFILLLKCALTIWKNCIKPRGDQSSRVMMHC